MLEVILESTVVGIYLVQDWVFRYVNSAFARIFGYQPEELIDKLSPLDLVHPDDRAMAKKNIQERIEGRVPHVHSVCKGLRKDGATIWCEAYGSRIDYEGKPAVVGTLLDITERKRAEEALRESEERYRDLVEKSGLAIFVLDAEGRVIFFNRHVCELSGCEPVELEGAHFANWVHPEDRERVLGYHHRRMAGDFTVPERCEFRWPCKDGSFRHVAISVTPIVKEGHVVGSRVYLYDITEQKKLMEELEESKWTLQRSLESLNEAVVMVDTDFVIKVCNRANSEIMGVPEDQCVGKRCYKMFYGRDTVCPGCLAKRAMETKQKAYELRHRPDGMILERTAYPVLDEEGRVTGATILGLDITQQKRAEEALRESEERYRILVETARDVIFSLSVEGVITSLNRAFEVLTGWPCSQWIGRHFREIVYPDDLSIAEESFQRVLKGESSPPVDIRVRLKSGGYAVCEFTGNPVVKDGRIVGTLGVARDVTQRREMEEALRESEERYRTLVESSLTGIFIHQDGKYVFVNERFAQMHGYEPEELIGRDYLELIYPEDREAAKKRTELRLKGEKLPVSHELRRLTKDGRFFWCQMVATRINYRGKPAVMGNVIDITPQKQAEESMRKAITRLHLVLEQTVRAFATTIEKRDPYTAGHQHRVARLARAIAKEMGLSHEECVGIYMAGLVHDIGKISVPTDILNKPGRLSKAEFEILKAHPKVGYEILKEVEFPWPIADMVLQHHERLDGSGYPQGLKDGEILLGARILAVADVVEAIASHRPYRPALGIETALEEIQRGKGTLYDPEVVDICIRLFREKGFQFE